MPGDGAGDPAGITHLLAKAARSEGAKIYEDTPVDNILLKYINLLLSGNMIG